MGGNKIRQGLRIANQEEHTQLKRTILGTQIASDPQQSMVTLVVL